MKTSTDLYIYKTEANNFLIRKVKRFAKQLKIEDVHITENEDIYWIDFPDSFKYEYESLMEAIGLDFNVNRVYVDDSWQIDVISRKNVGSVVRIAWES